MAKDKNSGLTFTKAKKEDVKAFISKIGIARVDEQVAPISFLHAKPHSVLDCDITAHTFAYNEHSAKEFINRPDGFGSCIENAENSMLLFPVRLRNRPDLVKKYCDIVLPEGEDYEIPCLQAEIIPQKNGQNRIRFKFSHFHPYVNLIFECLGDCLIDPNGRGKEYTWSETVKDS